MVNKRNYYFTPRQLEYLKAMVEGHTTDRELAMIFRRSPNTIKHQIHLMNQAAGVNRRSKLVLAAKRYGWVESPPVRKPKRTKVK